ncbi:hypothetical protein chiPu_0009802 [Chiloscyllium punctatum]|uniref:Uncharacterized protein n=1 Tax=Chiloscyllium punctatum TaxID=137246 RepID=A0A401SLR5_CHIPU|nr:hypothetical protein [Chiloscyllium punctatum]
MGLRVSTGLIEAPAAGTGQSCSSLQAGPRPFVPSRAIAKRHGKYVGCKSKSGYRDPSWDTGYMLGCLDKFKAVAEGHQPPKTKNCSQRSTEAAAPSAPADTPETAPPPYSTQYPKLTVTSSDSDSQVDEIAALVASRLHCRDAAQYAGAVAFPNISYTSLASQGHRARPAGYDDCPCFQLGGYCLLFHQWCRSWAE